jgi:hypothetical protein
MFGSRKACSERAELETKISECIGLLAELTVKGPGPTPKQEEEVKSSDLIAFQKTQVALSARLRALRECLESHREWHRC